MTLHTQTLTNAHTKYQAFTPYRLQRYSLDKILMVKVTTAISKVKLRPDHDDAHLLLEMSLQSINFPYFTFFEI